MRIFFKTRFIYFFKTINKNLFQIKFRPNNRLQIFSKSAARGTDMATAEKASKPVLYFQ